MWFGRVMTMLLVGGGKAEKKNGSVWSMTWGKQLLKNININN